MLHVNICPECGIPETFTTAHKWLDNGDIVQRTFEGARMSFIECENLDPLFRNVGDIIGYPIEGLVTIIVTRGTTRYIREVIPQEVREMVREGRASVAVLVKPMTTFCHVLGYGRYESSCAIYNGDENDFYRQTIFNPFSVPEAAGALAGVVGGVVGGEHSVAYEEISPGLYEFTTSRTVFPGALKERVQLNDYAHKDGDIDLEPCATCGGPKAFSELCWDLDQGTIVNERTGRRMAILSSQLLDSLFDALEKELGDTIPEVVVEAQRRFTKTGFYSIDDVGNEEEFRTQLALRGMGNLREFRMGVGGLRMRLTNASGHLILVGMAQGIFEIALDVDSCVEWELSEDGDLLVEVTPRCA